LAPLIEGEVVSSTAPAWHVSDKGKGGGGGGEGVEGGGDGHKQNGDNKTKKILLSNYDQMKAKSITLTNV
jgi:hypothetical protein